jgi:hypothetical protein
VVLRKTILAAALLLTSSSVASATPMMCGSVAEERVNELTSQIQWFHSLKKAEETAQKENKMIFWMHMVGHLDGAT